MLRRRFSAVSKHEGPSPFLRDAREGRAPRDEVCVYGSKAYCAAGLIAQDTLTVTCSVSSPCATEAPAAAMGAAIRR